MGTKEPGLSILGIWRPARRREEKTLGGPLARGEAHATGDASDFVADDPPWRRFSNPFRVDGVMSMMVALVMAALAGAQLDAFRAELATASKRGYVAAFRLLGSQDESREACQEAAFRALSSAERYDPQQPFYPWFYRILKNHCIDRLRERSRMVAGDVPGSVEASAEGRLLQGERETAVTEAIHALDQDLREVIELRHFQEATYEEMAVILDCPMGTVMSRLYRARKTLRDRLVKDPRFLGSPKGKGGEG